MNTKALNSLADLICRAQENGARTPMGIAMAIESAGRHMSPEVAVKLHDLQARVDEVERKYTFDTAELKRQLDSERVDGGRLIRAEQRRAELEAVLASHRKDDQAEIERLRAQVAELRAERHATNEALVDVTVALRAVETVPSQGVTPRPPAEGVSPQVQKLRALLAGQREALEGEHYQHVHHEYRTPHDLPPLGGVQ